MAGFGPVEGEFDRVARVQPIRRPLGDVDAEERILGIDVPNTAPAIDAEMDEHGRCDRDIQCPTGCDARRAIAGPPDFSIDLWPDALITLSGSLGLVDRAPRRQAVAKSLANSACLQTNGIAEPLGLPGKEPCSGIGPALQACSGVRPTAFDMGIMA